MIFLTATIAQTQALSIERDEFRPMYENIHFSKIQGDVNRVEQLGDLILTETSYSPGLRLDPHAHRRACFGFVLAGAFSERFLVERLSYGGRSVFFRPPELVHANRVSRAGARCFYVEVSSAWLRHVEQYSPLPVEPTSFETGTLGKLANGLYDQWQEMDEVGPLAIEGLAYEIAAHFCRSIRVKREMNPPRWVKQVHEILCCHFKESLQLADIAKKVQIHPVHVAREFHRYYGNTVGQFRRQCRINFACDKLAHSNLPIIEIAFEAGFAQQAHFTEVFKRLTGVTPHRYRKLHR